MDFAEMGTGVEKFADKQLQNDPWDKQGSCSPAPADNYGLYFCPSHTTGTSRSACGGVVERYCKKWSCVSTGHIWWDPPTTNDYIHITRLREQLPCSSWPCCGQRLNPLIITFTTKGKLQPREKWMAGFTWGGRQWDGAGDEGNIFTIRLSLSMPTFNIGPNKQIKPTFLHKSQTEVNPLVQLVNSSFALLKHTLNDSSKTDQCWLCLSDLPPFYEAVASNEPIRNSTSDASCRWSNSSITITDIIGTGCCLGNIPANYSQYCFNVSSGYGCNLYLPRNRLGLRGDFHGALGPVYTHSTGNISARLRGQYFIPGNNSMWACSTGATACAHGDELIAQKAFCIQVKLLPKITFHPGPELINELEPPQFPLRQKREIVTALTLSVLLGLGAAGAATGVAALTVGHQQVAALSLQIDNDLQRIETSISALQTSLSSLAEVALQNRRGLDLLYLNKGGLCVALKEECCFYADHSGIVKDSMAELRKRLKDRENERQQGQPWYQGMFNFSPWLTTLLSALIGPLVILLLACTIGPCVLGRLLTFLKNRLKTLGDEVVTTQKRVSFLTTFITSTDNIKQPLLGWSSDQESEDEESPSKALPEKGLLLHFSPDGKEEISLSSKESTTQGSDMLEGMLAPCDVALEDKGFYLDSGSQNKRKGGIVTILP